MTQAEIQTKNVNSPLEALLSKHFIMLEREALTSVQRMNKRSLFEIGQGQVSVRCGKIYRKDSTGAVWMKSDSDTLSKLLAFLYSINLIECNKDNVVVFTKEYRAMTALFRRCNTNF
tara:strand:+ start:204 stop:554 length:351 start_codon:yes stop_codon:yes gene_type:complete